MGLLACLSKIGVHFVSHVVIVAVVLVIVLAVKLITRIAYQPKGDLLSSSLRCLQLGNSQNISIFFEVQLLICWSVVTTTVTTQGSHSSDKTLNDSRGSKEVNNDLHI